MKVVVEFSRREACPTCNGSGAKPGAVTCVYCFGTGIAKKGEGIFKIITKCSMCSGSGKFGGSACSACHGAKLSKMKREIEIIVPAGITDGQRLRLVGQGDRSVNGGPPGDLFCDIAVAGSSST